jgi:hypothetical protein
MINGLLLTYNMDKSTEQLFEAPAPELLKKLEYFLKKEDKRKIMKQLPDLHEAAFEKIDCLDLSLIHI